METAVTFPLLIYVPGHAGRYFDNSYAAVNLASHGYIVAAIDDPAFDDADLPPDETSAGKAGEDDGLVSGFEQRIAATERLLKIQVNRASHLLNVIEQAPNGVLGAIAPRVDRHKIGIFGFSNGGSAAASAAVLDQRIKAVANLDGWLYNEASYGIGKPYLSFYSEDALASQELTPADEENRFVVYMNGRDNKRNAVQSLNATSHWFLLRNSSHTDFSDALIVSPKTRFFRLTAGEPDRWRALIDVSLVTFFDFYVKHDELSGTPHFPFAPDIQNLSPHPLTSDPRDPNRN